MTAKIPVTPLRIAVLIPCYNAEVAYRHAAAAAGLNLLLDMDTQQNATQWGRRRKAAMGDKSLPLVKFTTENDLPDELAKAAAAGCELVVIDTPLG